MKKRKKAASRKPAAAKLTLQQERFVEEYLKDLNATKAAVRSGYGEKGAHVRGSTLLKKPAVREAVDRAIAERSARTKITQDRVLEELFHLFTSNVENYEMGDDHQPVVVKDGVSQDAMRAVASVKKRVLVGNEEGPMLEVVEFRLWDKPRALSLAMRHLGMLNDKLTINLDEELKKVVGNAAGDFERGIAGIVARLQEGKASG